MLFLRDYDDRTVDSRDNWRRVQDNDPGLTRLDVSLKPFLHIHEGNIYSDIGLLGRHIGNNKHIRELHVNGAYYEGDDVREARQICQLFSEGVNQNQLIEQLSLSCGEDDFFFAGELCRFFSPLLENNKLLMLQVSVLTREGLRCLTSALMRRGRPLEKLILGQVDLDNDVDDDSVREFLMALSENPGLAPNKLVFRGDNISNLGWNPIIGILHDARFTMEGLYIAFNSTIENNSATTIADALVGNTTLKELCLGATYVTEIGYCAFSQSLCNKTSIKATHSSNHTLQSLGVFPPYERCHSFLSDIYKLSQHWFEKICTSSKTSVKLNLRTVVQHFSLMFVKTMLFLRIFN